MQETDILLRSAVIISREAFKDLYSVMASSFHHANIKKYFTFEVVDDPRVRGNDVLMNPLQRALCGASVGEELVLEPCVCSESIASICFEVFQRPCGA